MRNPVVWATALFAVGFLAGRLTRWVKLKWKNRHSPLEDEA